jgi:hypothetical protein
VAEYALVNGERISASQYTRDEWKKLKPSIKMLCCGEPGHVVRNNLGTQYFRHKPNSLCITQEVKKTEEHRFLESCIYRICRELGWQMKSEVSRFEIFGQSNSYWIADILANKNEKFVIFEIPLSNITSLNVTKYNEKFINDSIPSYWFFDINQVDENEIRKIRNYGINAYRFDQSEYDVISKGFFKTTLEFFLTQILKYHEEFEQNKMDSDKVRGLSNIVKKLIISE